MDLNFLKAVNEGNQEEIVSFYSKNYPAVKRFVLKNKGSVEDSEDIFQKALLQLIVRFKNEPFKITTSFEAYFFTVCKNLWRRELNKSKKRVTKREIIEYVNEIENQAMAIVEQKRYELFTEKLYDISENCKNLLTLFFSKTPYAEIMRLFNYSSENVVKQRVFKCKKKLTDLIKNDKRYNSLKNI